MVTVIEMMIQSVLYRDIQKFIRELHRLTTYVNIKYDGDTLNIHYITNKQFYESAFRVFNPRNAMYISRNDGYFNSTVNHNKDLVININTMINLSRKNYSHEQLDKIHKLMKEG